MPTNINMMFTRSASDLAIKLLYILAINGRMMNIDDLALWANRDDSEKVRKECNVLAEMGYIQIVTKEKNEKFYQLADSAQGMLPGFAQILPAPVENPVHGKPATETPMIIDVVENGQKTAENPVFDGQIAPVHGKPATGDSRLESSLESLDSLNLLKDLEDSNSLDSGADAGNPETEFERILDGKTSAETLCKQAFLLFGKPVRCDDVISSRTLLEILGWMAQAYQERENLMHPYGVVYRGLRRELKKRGKVDSSIRPDPQYAQPFEHLPSEYLSAVGLENYIVSRCKKCGMANGKHTEHCECVWTEWREIETETVVIIEPGMINPALDERRNGGLAMSINDSWARALTTLQQEMPRASFETWVRDTMPSSWDEKTYSVTVATRNSYARDWLESRFTPTCERILSDLLEAPTKIKFCVARDEEE